MGERITKKNKKKGIKTRTRVRGKLREGGRERKT